MIERIFVSSVQKELAAERRAIRDFVQGDALLRRFFEVFLFEDLPASDRRADEVYLDEVGRCGVYLGIFGDDYGCEDKDGVSPTEREFDEATSKGVVRLIFVKGRDDRSKHPKMRALIGKAGAQLIRRRFDDVAELRTGLYAALVQLLVDRELIRTGPFDAAVCPKAALDDLSEEEIRRFVKAARGVRGFPLGEETAPEEVMAHLQLLNDGRPTHAAVLLFGKQPQRFLISSEVKCAHFHGTTRSKPIPFYRTYKGTVFETTDQAVDFVMSKLNVAVGTREHST